MSCDNFKPQKINGSIFARDYLITYSSLYFHCVQAYLTLKLKDILFVAFPWQRGAFGVVVNTLHANKRADGKGQLRKIVL